MKIIDKSFILKPQNLINRISLIFFTFLLLLFAQSGEEIIKQVDKNMVVNSSSYRAIMRISFGGDIREKKFFGYTLGRNLAYMEFTAPARDKGTRFLKIKNEMWIYLPSVEKATKIAGHMLRQSMMGSDFSYDDITENENLIELYKIELIGTETVDDIECFKLGLNAKVPEVNYYTRNLWVDKDRYVPIKAELYARSGKLMKEIYYTDFKKIKGHYYPMKIKMINKLRENTYTEMILDDIEIDIKIQERFFTKSYLERK